MARPPRLQLAGGIFHVCSRGARKSPIYHDDEDRELLLKPFALVCVRYGWRCHAYCLMTNHFHLLVGTPNEDLSAGMQRLDSRYAQLFNIRHGYEGHALERRFYSELVESDEHLLALARYIVLNPVRAGLCASAVEWPWSSYRATVGLERAPYYVEGERLFRFFGTNAGRARELYAWFVDGGIVQEAGSLGTWPGPDPEVRP